MAEIPGITSGDPSNQSLAVQTAISGLGSVDANEAITVDEQRTAIDSINDTTAILKEYQPKIYQTIDKLSENIATFISGFKDQTMNVNLAITGANVDGVGKLLNLLGKKKSKNRLDKSANAIQSTLSIIAGAERFVEPANKVIDTIVKMSTVLAETGKGLKQAALGLALVGLAVAGIGMLFASEPTFLLGFVGAMIAVGGALYLFNKLVNEKELLKTAASIAMFGLAIWGVVELLEFDADGIKNIAGFAISLAVIGGALWLVNKLIDPGRTVLTSLALAAVGLSMIVLGKGVAEFSDISWDTLAITGAAIVGIGGAFALAGSLAANIALGAAGMGAVALAVYGLGKALNVISGIDLTFAKLGMFGTATAGIVGSMILIGNPVTLPLLLSGVLQVAAVAGATFLLAKAMDAISTANVPPEDVIDTFVYGAKGIRNAFVEIGNPVYLPLIISGVAQAVAIAAGTVAVAGALYVVSKTPVLDNATYDSFEYGVNTLANIFADVGGPLKLLAITAGAGAATLMSGATIAIATGITIFSNIISDPDKVGNAIMAMDRFVSGTVDIFSKFDADQYESVAIGIASFSGISNLVGEIAGSVVAIGNLRFETKELRNGKLVTTGSRQLTEADFAKVGTSIGVIITALTKPLAAIGDQTEGLIFKSNKVEDGIEALTNIGNVFIPLTDLLTIFTAQNIDKKFVDTFNTNLSILVQGVADALGNASVEFDEDDLEAFEEGTELLDGFVSNIIDKDLTTGSTNLKSVSDNLVSIKDTIKDIDLERISSLNDLMINIREMEDSEVLERLAEAFEKLAEALKPVESETIQTQQGNQTTVNNTSNVQKQQTQELIESIETSNAGVQEVLTEISDILSGTLNVKMKQQPI